MGPTACVATNEATLSHLYPSNYPVHLHTNGIRSRIPALDTKSRTTVSDMLRAVTTLERWLWSKHDEHRQMFLEEFWLVLTRESGVPYEPVTFRKYRYCIDRFLTENGHPFSITTSGDFANSQAACSYRLTSYTKKNKPNQKS